MNRHEKSAAAQPFDDLISVREAALVLRVSESTVWRWINEGLVPSYRVGRKRVYLKQAELTPLLQPRRSGGLTEEQRRQWNAVPMNPNRRRDIDPVELARALHAKYLANHGGKPMPEAWEDINEAREQRSRDLAPDAEE